MFWAPDVTMQASAALQIHALISLTLHWEELQIGALDVENL